MSEAYGDTHVRNTLFAETADQLQLEAAAAAAPDLKQAAVPSAAVADAALDARIQPQHGQASRLGASNGTVGMQGQEVPWLQGRDSTPQACLHHPAELHPAGTWSCTVLWHLAFPSLLE